MRYRHALAVIAGITVAVLGIAGCGGDDDAAESKPTLPDDNDLLGEDAYIVVFSKSVQDPESGFGAAAEEADCAAEAAVAGVGADRLQAAGLDEAWLTSDESPATDLTADEADAIVDALFDCIDMSAAIAASLAADEDRLPADESECLSDALGDAAVLRTYLARSLREGTETPMSVDEAHEFVDAMLACVDFGPSFANDFTGPNGEPMTPEQVECISEQLRNSDDYRDLIVTELSGGESPSDEEIGSALVDEIGACVPLDQLGGTPGASSA